MHEKKLRAILSLCALAILILSAAVLILAFFAPNGIIKDVILLTHHTAQRPKIFGAFHLTSLAVCIALTAAVFVFHPRLPKRYLDLTVFSSGAVLLLLEVYKQLYHHLILGNGHYNFGILPLQFCSYSLYLFLLVPLLPEGRIKQTLYSFCALYQVMGGCIVMGYPTLYKELPLSIHTMLWHTVMIVTGVLILKKLNFGRRFFGELLPPTAVFLVTAAIAVSLNYLLTPYTKSSPSPLNLFYMSPYESNNYFLVSQVRTAFGWLPSLVCYLLLFILIGAPLVWLVAWLTKSRASVKK